MKVKNGKPPTYAPWQISEFPVSLRQRFVGKVKGLGRNVPEVLEILIAKYMTENHENN